MALEPLEFTQANAALAQAAMDRLVNEMPPLYVGQSADMDTVRRFLAAATTGTAALRLVERIRETYWQWQEDKISLMPFMELFEEVFGHRPATEPPSGESREEQG